MDYKKELKAGENVMIKYGIKAQKKILEYSVPFSQFYLIPVDGDGFWRLGVNKGKDGKTDYIRHKDTFFPVNSRGIVYVHKENPKSKKFVEMVNDFYNEMIRLREIQKIHQNFNKNRS